MWDCTSLKYLREEHRCVPFPFLVLLAAAINLVVFLLADGDAGNPKKEVGSKEWTDKTQAEGSRPVVPDRSLDGSGKQHAGCNSCDACPQRRLSEVIGIAASCVVSTSRT